MKLMKALRDSSIHPRSIYWVRCNLLWRRGLPMNILDFQKKASGWPLPSSPPILAFADNHERFCRAEMWHLTAWFCYLTCENDTWQATQLLKQWEYDLALALKNRKARFWSEGQFCAVWTSQGAGGELVPAAIPSIPFSAERRLC